mgnify:FL=1
MALKSVASSKRASAGMRYPLTFDFSSFATGLLAGALVGALAGYLHETETVGELQERVRVAMLQFERIRSRASGERSEEPVNVDLQEQLLQLQDEIKRLYRRPER